MFSWTIYYENADTDDPAKPLGVFLANTEADALQLASEYYEIPSHDLVAKRQ